MFNSKKAFSYLVLLSLVLLLTNIHSFPLTDRDEGEYAACALEMLTNKNFIVPTLNGRPYLEKPILFHWILASSFIVFGANEFAARLPSVLSAFFLVIILSSFLHFYSKDKKISILSGLILITNPLFLIHARACITDIVLTFFITTSLICLFCFLEKSYNKKLFLWILSSTFISLAFLTKGPISIAIFWPILIIYTWIISDFTPFRAKYLIVFLSIFFIINLPWHVLIYKRLGIAFFETFYVTQNLERFTKTLLGHGGGPFLYFFVIIIGFFPYAQFGTKALIENIKNRRPNFYLFCTISFLWIFSLLSLSATKQLNYILPSLPFLSVLAAQRLHILSKIEENKMEKFIFLLATTLFFLVLLVPIFIQDNLWNWILNMVRFDSTAYALPPKMPDITSWCIIFLCLILFLVITYFYNEDKLLFISGTLVFSFIFSALFLPTLANKIQGPAKHIARKIYHLKNKINNEELEIQAISYGLWKPSMIFYAQMPIRKYKVKHIEKINAKLEEKKAIFVFTRTRLLKKLISESKKFFPIEIQQGYMIGGNKKAKDIYMN